MRRAALTLLALVGVHAAAQLRNPMLDDRYVDSEQVFNSAELARIDLTIRPLHLQMLHQNPRMDFEFPADMRFRNALLDETLPSVGLRFRGNVFSRDAQKKSWNIDFNEFVDDQRFHGLRQFNLNSHRNDPSIIRGHLMMEFCRRQRIAAPRSHLTTLYINGEYHGVYVNTEQVDKTFLRAWFTDSSGSLWKCTYPGEPADLTWRGSDPETYRQLGADSPDGDPAGYVHLFDPAGMGETCLVDSGTETVISGALFPEHLQGVRVAIDNSNLAGIEGGRFAADQPAAALVETGFEIFLPAAAMGRESGFATGDTVRLFCFINNDNGDNRSNQSLPGLPSGTGAGLSRPVDFSSLVSGTFEVTLTVSSGAFAASGIVADGHVSPGAGGDQAAYLTGASDSDRVLQTIETEFGDNRNELDQAHARLFTDGLAVAVMGNIDVSGRGNQLLIFVDSVPGQGDTTLDLIPHDALPALMGMEGDTLPIQADFAVSATCEDFGDDGDSPQCSVTWADLTVGPDDLGGTYELQTNTGDPNAFDQLVRFLDVLNNTPDGSFAAEFSALFDVAAYRRALAAEVAFGHWDNHWHNPNNFYLYHIPATDTFEFIIYDVDNTMGIQYTAMDTGTVHPLDFGPRNSSRPLPARVLAVPDWQQTYLETLGGWFNSSFTPAAMEAEVQFSHDLIDDAVQTDPFYPLDQGYSFSDFNASFNGPLGYSHVVYGVRDFIATRSDIDLPLPDPEPHGLMIR
jgi:spore coat protein CotH